MVFDPEALGDASPDGLETCLIVFDRARSHPCMVALSSPRSHAQTAEVDRPTRWWLPKTEHRTKSSSSSGSDIERGVASKNSHFTFGGRIQRNISLLTSWLPRFRIEDHNEFGVCG